MCLYLFLAPLLFKIGGTSLLDMEIAFLVNGLCWFFAASLYLRRISLPVLSFLAFAAYLMISYTLMEKNPRSFITLCFVISVAQFLVISCQKTARDCGVFLAYGLIAAAIILLIGNWLYSGLNAFSVDEFGKNLLHQHLKAGESFGGNKNNLAGGIFYGFIGVTGLFLYGKIQPKYFFGIVLFAFLILLQTASTRYIFSTSVIFFGVTVLMYGRKGAAVLISLFALVYSISNSFASKINLAFMKVVAMTGGETESSYAIKAAAGRKELFDEGIDVFLSNPLLGIGLENIRTKLGHFSHVDPLEVLVAAGLFGSMFYFLFFFGFFLAGLGFKRLNNLGFSLNPSRTVFHVSLLLGFSSLALVGTVFNNPLFWQGLWLIFIYLPFNVMKT